MTRKGSRGKASNTQKKSWDGQYYAKESHGRLLPRTGSRGKVSTAKRKVAGGLCRAMEVMRSRRKFSTAQIRSRVVSTAQWKVREGQYRALEVTGRS